MFKAKIIVNSNGKQTIMEFDNEQEYYDYLESHPEINQQFNRANGRNSLPAWNWGWEWADRMNANRPGLSYKDREKDLSPIALVKHDMRRLEHEEKQKQIEQERKQRQKELAKKELEEAKELLETYKSKPGHDPEYVKKLEAHIKETEKAE